MGLERPSDFDLSAGAAVTNVSDEQAEALQPGGGGWGDIPHMFASPQWGPGCEAAAGTCRRIPDERGKRFWRGHFRHVPSFSWGGKAVSASDRTASTHPGRYQDPRGPAHQQASQAEHETNAFYRGAPVVGGTATRSSFRFLPSGTALRPETSAARKMSMFKKNKVNLIFLLSEENLYRVLPNRTDT